MSVEAAFKFSVLSCSEVVPNPEDIKSVSREAAEIADNVLSDVKKLKNKSEDLKDIIDVASRYDEIAMEIKENRELI